MRGCATPETPPAVPARPRPAAAPMTALLLLAVLAVLTAIALSTLFTVPAARAAVPSVALQRVVGGLDAPVYAASPPGDTQRLFIVEKSGNVRILRAGVLLSRPFIDLSARVSHGGEQGLLSIAFHPRFAANGRVFVNYTNGSGNTKIVEYRKSADPDVVDPGTRRELLTVRQPYANHNGGQLQFGPDGRLYIGMGDGGSAGDPQGRAQDPRSRLGKLLRMNVDAVDPTARVYALGLRNPWRFSFDRANGNLWVGDVGQNRWEEIDFLRAGIKPGANFGWNAYEGRHLYNATTAARLSRARLVWPVAEYSHALGEAVTGGYVYRGAAIPGLRGSYVFGDYASGRVWFKTSPRATKAELTGVTRVARGLSSFGEDAAGELYLVSLSGTVDRLIPAP